MNDIKVRLIHSNMDFGYDVYVYQEHSDGCISIVDDLQTWAMTKYEPGQKMNPTFDTHRTSMLQAFADALYEVGIKAKKEPILENELSATKAHLEDMRGLVFSSNIKRAPTKPFLVDIEKIGEIKEI